MVGRRPRGRRRDDDDDDDRCLFYVYAMLLPSICSMLRAAARTQTYMGVGRWYTWRRTGGADVARRAMFYFLRTRAACNRDDDVMFQLTYLSSMAACRMSIWTDQTRAGDDRRRRRADGHMA